MVLVSDVLIPARFLAFLGHFFAGLLALYAVVSARCHLEFIRDGVCPGCFFAAHTRLATASSCIQRDSVIVALPFTYTTSDFDASITSARSSIWVLFACLAINACAFFFGFNTFNIGQGIFRACLTRQHQPPATKFARELICWSSGDSTPAEPSLCSRPGRSHLSLGCWHAHRADRHQQGPLPVSLVHRASVQHAASACGREHIRRCVCSRWQAKVVTWTSRACVVHRPQPPASDPTRCPPRHEVEEQVACVYSLDKTPHPRLSALCQGSPR